MRRRTTPRTTLLAPLMATLVAATGSGCVGPSPSPGTAPAPVPAAPTPAAAPVPATGGADPRPTPATASLPRGRLLTLPARLPPTSWTVRRTTSLQLEGSRTAQAMSEEARLTLQWERTPAGTLHGRGTVTGYRLDSRGDEGTPPRPPIQVPSLAVQLTVDSTQWQLLPDPPLVGACEREESTVAQLAGLLTPRIPDGMAEGSQWRDSTVSVTCRGGVALRVTRLTRSTLVRWEGDTIAVTRDVTLRLEGRGGRPFQAARVEGEGMERQLILLSASTGTPLRSDGQGTLRLRLRDGEKEQRLRQETAWTISP